MDEVAIYLGIGLFVGILIFTTMQREFKRIDREP